MPTRMRVAVLVGLLILPAMPEHAWGELLSGAIDSVDVTARRISVKKSNGEIVTFTVTARTSITLDRKECKLEDIAAGDQVSVSSDDSKVATKIAARFMRPVSLPFDPPEGWSLKKIEGKGPGSYVATFTLDKDGQLHAAVVLYHGKDTLKDVKAIRGGITLKAGSQAAAMNECRELAREAAFGSRPDPLPHLAAREFTVNGRTQNYIHTGDWTMRGGALGWGASPGGESDVAGGISYRRSEKATDWEPDEKAMQIVLLEFLALAQSASR